MEEKEAREYLKGLFKQDIRKGKHPVVYTILKHVSNSGMLRHIDVIYIKDNKPIKLNWYIEKMGLYKRGSMESNNSDSLRVGGCGMDMGFNVVYSLSRNLYLNGHNCLGEYCHSNDHVNGDRNYDRRHKHKDSGYLLTQSWI